jgi:hypothetical protein
MSDKTIFNQDLTLNSLTLNNSIDSHASGYVASSTTINSNVVSTSQVVTSQITLYNNTGTSPTPPSIITSSNNVQILTAPAGGLTLSNTAGQSTLLSTGSSGLTINDVVLVPSLTVGTDNNVCSVQSPAFNTLGIGGANTGILDCGSVNASTSVNSLAVSVGSGNNICSIQSPAFNTLGIGGANTGILDCGTVNASSAVSAPTVNANLFAGGIQAYASTINVNFIAGASASYTKTFTFPSYLNSNTFSWFFQPVWNNNTDSGVNLTSAVQNAGAGTIDITFSVANYNTSAGANLLYVNILGVNLST